MVSLDTLLRQAPMTAHEYFVQAHKTLRESGLAFTAADVVALAAVAAQDMESMVKVRIYDGIVEEVQAIRASQS